MRGGIDPGDRRFRPRFVGVVDMLKVTDAWMGPYLPRVALVPRTTTNQRSASGVGVSTPCGVVSTRGTAVLSPVRRVTDIWKDF